MTNQFECEGVSHHIVQNYVAAPSAQSNIGLGWLCNGQPAQTIYIVWALPRPKRMPNTFFRWAPTTGCGPFKSLVSVKSWVSKQLPPSKVYRGKLQQLIKLGLLKWSCIEPTRKNISPEISKIFQYIYLYVHDLFMLNIIHVFQCSLKAVYISSSISQIRCFTDLIVQLKIV